MEIDKLLDLFSMSYLTKTQIDKLYHYTDLKAFTSIVKTERYMVI